MTALLLLLVALNDPLYIMRVVLGGNQTMYNVSVLAQIAFSGGLFLFCLAYADGLNRTGGERPICTFYLPKLVLVSAYVLSAAAVFVLHGRVPDRISVSEGAGGEQQLLVLIGSLTASLLGVGAWLSFLVARAVYRLGWKKVCRKHIKAPDSSHPRTQTLPRETPSNLPPSDPPQPSPPNPAPPLPTQPLPPPPRSSTSTQSVRRVSWVSQWYFSSSGCAVTSTARCTADGARGCSCSSPS